MSIVYKNKSEVIYDICNIKKHLFNRISDLKYIGYIFVSKSFEKVETI